MTYFRSRLIASSAVTLLALLVPFNALAQKDVFRRAVGSDQDSNRAYGAGYTSKYALNETARRLAYRSQRFQWQLERELNSSYLDGTSREKRANQLSVRFHQAAETLRSLYAVGRSVDNSTTEASNLLRLGYELDDFVSRAPVSWATLESWEAISGELFLLVTVYDFDAAALEDAGTDKDAASAPVVEYHSAAMSYGRIWGWPF